MIYPKYSSAVMYILIILNKSLLLQMTFVTNELCYQEEIIFGCEDM